jgi:hypothetical protein
MSIKIGNYIHAKPLDDNSKEVEGTVLEVNNDFIVLDNSIKVSLGLYKITIFENVTSLLTNGQLSRIEAMKRHPAGKGFRV